MLVRQHEQLTFVFRCRHGSQAWETRFLCASSPGDPGAGSIVAVLPPLLVRRGIGSRGIATFCGGRFEGADEGIEGASG